MTTRRSVLATAGGLLLGALGYGLPATADPDRLLTQPTVYQSRGGALTATLTIDRTQVQVDGLGSVRTRMYQGGIPGPTLRVRPGDTLRLFQINRLPPDVVAMHGDDHNIPHGFNTVNLHTHGLHVSPRGSADNVFRQFPPRARYEDPVPPPYLTEIQIPVFHESGTYWYHPHVHGSSAVQLLSGMSGAVVVEGEVDEVPEIADARDLVVCLNELKLRDGEVPDYLRGSDLELPSTYLVNGQVNPLVRMRPGEVQRWRLVNAGAATVQNVALTGHLLHQIARDGITFNETASLPVVSLPMGGRADVLVQATGEPGGRYALTSDGLTLMTVEIVNGPPLRMGVPSELPGAPSMPFIEPRELTPTGPHGNGRRTLIFRSVDHALPGDFPTAFRILGDGATPATFSESDPADPTYGRFAPGYVNQVLEVGAVEEWTLRNDSPTHVNHPFHLHTNPFLVVSVDGRPLATPVWTDTFSIGQYQEVVIRARFQDFTGRAVLHCHNIMHEDQGMMQIVQYV